jgi:ribosome biogenesis GTPase
MTATPEEGRIYKALSGFYFVETDSGTAVCRARGRFRVEKNTPLVGDKVRFIHTEPGKGYLTELLPRNNVFVRPPVANVDKLVIVASASIPVTDPFLIDRMTVTARKCGCESIICMNKCDLDPADRLFDIYNSAGFATIRTSAETGEGLGALLEAMSGGLCVLAGNSGVGKSSILNMFDREFRINVGEVSKKLGRGRHTTRHVELYKLPGDSIVADTPGFSAYEAESPADREELSSLFPDISAFGDACRFHDCAHIKEPGCTVLSALERGDLQKTRYESYVRMYRQTPDKYR